MPGQKTDKVKVSLGKALNMLGPYAWAKVKEQIRTVALIVCYLVAFQLFVLSIPIADAAMVAFGIGVVILGLAFFMEGLFLGLMPLGEICGIRLPQKTALPVILIFAFILGLGATFAEPAIGVLRKAGASVSAWDAPLLFLLLNKHADALVWAVGTGVGIAVLFGMLRFLNGWSLKPFIFVLYAMIGALSIWFYFDPNLVKITGLAWDCGAVTTGPVTVPLVLALGIGISRVASRSSDSDTGGGFGLVTLASAFPILAVLSLGLFFSSTVPNPTTDVAFSSPANRFQTINLFSNQDALKGYVLQKGSSEARLALFDGRAEDLDDYVVGLSQNIDAQTKAFGNAETFDSWLLNKGSSTQRLRVYGSEALIAEKMAALQAEQTATPNIKHLVSRSAAAALQAIVPLSLFLMLVLFVVLRERIRRMDEMFLGIGFAVIGMTLFSLGIELGLSRLGGDIGTNLPSSFKAVEVSQQREVIRDFNPDIVSLAITPDGSVEAFFNRKTSVGFQQLPYHPENFDPDTRQYEFTPTRGPISAGFFGILIVIGFGFMMGYGATLAEPALNTLGVTVEELTVGTFKKSLLMQAVGIGVGVGIAFGVAKIIYDWPLIWMLLPPYLALMVLTVISNEDFVNIGWDSAGVTTGPVTVPLVLAMGLGISHQIGSIEGFGILALASVWPILSVLLVGLHVTHKRRADLEEEAPSSA